ncbi:hypothetical protein [Kaistella jeonii]|uniref:Uncharacterized protein n=1 Tax=Kaistella jeonii TaxID=266749 RepID=A0A0C1F4N1_9FLAO|nr:hypothetical protein [Kaistella jeonii]KIA88072.1 hypothetical protein OA86_12800 [Kaistella jeonii]SFC31693.1 hypothetical protein SAMN05421876_11356 [Kaistella jeonii]VEI95616.1 Uncharacterised protein [Kaistella jeonii]
MDVVKIPKKLKTIFQEIRDGNIELGNENLKNYKDFEPQKNIVFAQMNYFESNYEQAMLNDENSLLFNEQWYPGNILTEHFFAYTNTAIKINQIERAEKFYNFFLETKEMETLPAHQINQYRYLVEQHILKLNGEKNLKLYPEKLSLITEGKKISEIELIQQKHRKDLNNKNIEKIEYLLNFMITDCNSKLVFEYYEKYCEEIKSENIHFDIARLYCLANDENLARKATLKFVENWFPIDFLQIVPMKFFEYEEMNLILTDQFKVQILNSRKAIT